MSARTQELNLTNEGGLDGTYRLLKNIMGLWLVQQCKRAFDARGRKYEYGELAQMAAKAPPLRSIVNPDDSRFLNPPDMPKAIQDFCRETRQPVPKTEGELVRCAYESLALKYREVLGWLEELTGNRIEVIHIVGGGSKSAILNQFTADACQRPVMTGPVEATAMGNLLVQVRASGELASLAEMREVIRKSSDVATCQPGTRRLGRSLGPFRQAEQGAIVAGAPGRFKELPKRRSRPDGWGILCGFESQVIGFQGGMLSGPTAVGVSTGWRGRALLAAAGRHRRPRQAGGPGDTRTV